ncbi:acetyl-CoA synthase subunit gamma [Clostridium sp. D2Q-11]|uniref:Acetyl-CoA synthase subunit gamma n=1 Tax=Anaeromonas frigoriresistens TaxID=2683708 RepID=A0A942Z7B9_9FIRM|nr:acetyl-CoA synthase subunit gamma [Anaeromonas frigoriresistens]
MIEGYISTPIGDIKKIKTYLSKKDILQDIHTRIKIKRDDFRIETGVYAIGDPDKTSPVLITANYKLTFDKLRKELQNLNLWILVIDTKGINVWCAAGKGTFGTEEIINKVVQTKLVEIVAHKNLMLPQLGAPGVSAHTIKKYTGFKVIYGPVRAEDIPEFLATGYKATEEMRKVEFNLYDRLVLTPLELIISLRYFIMIPILLFILNLISGQDLGIEKVLNLTILESIPYLGAFIIGTLVVPLLLPIIPFRSFSLKGVVIGIIWSMVTAYIRNMLMLDFQWIILIANGLILTSIITVLSLNFTGSSTYTSFSGVMKETVWTYPFVILASLIGVMSMIVGKIGDRLL